jgi:polyisoprenyl-teichoic acid--peptidoglycan teichoic acid transferase
MRSRSKKPAARPAKSTKRSSLIWTALYLAVAIAAGVLAFRFVEKTAANWSTAGIDNFILPGEANAEGSLEGDASLPQVSIDETPEPWNGTERVTILVMGLDYRDWETDDGPPRTDTMMLLTIDPITRTGGMLSIPRDLWVEIPGFSDHGRINTAYFLGEANRLPGGGPAMAMKTVENLLGIPVQYYAVIDFSAFERMIDEIGGIDVLVKEEMKISPIGRISIVLEPKGHHLDGAEALAYARARKTSGGDFDRAQRQQQVIFAIRDRILGFDMLPNLISSAPSLYQELKLGIQSNFFDPEAPIDESLKQLRQVISLAQFAFDIQPRDIKRGVIGPPEYVVPATMPADGAQVLLPVTEQIRLLRDEIFTINDAAGPSFSMESDGEVASAAGEESAQIRVLNGSLTGGLAGGTTEYLQTIGFSADHFLEPDNASAVYESSRLVIYNPMFPYTIQHLSNVFNLSDGQILYGVPVEGGVDLEIVLGTDWLLP